MQQLHVLISAEGLRNPPRDEATVEQWLSDLVDLIDMKVLIPAQAVRCDTPGNEGVTGIVCIETSHASVHVWDGVDEPFAKIDVFSCKLFDAEVVLDHVKKFKPTLLRVIAVDRETSVVIADGIFGGGE